MKTTSGLEYVETLAGTGAQAKAGDTVVVGIGVKHNFSLPTGIGLQ